MTMAQVVEASFTESDMRMMKQTMDKARSCVNTIQVILEAALGQILQEEILKSMGTQKLRQDIVSLQGVQSEAESTVRAVRREFGHASKCTPSAGP